MQVVGKIMRMGTNSSACIYIVVEVVVRLEAGRSGKRRVRPKHSMDQSGVTSWCLDLIATVKEHIVGETWFA